LTDWPGGYCSDPCTLYLDCAGEDDTVVCGNFTDERQCLAACLNNSCRDGYRCSGSLFACVPNQ
jgi:hypothetical protein